jgi:linoleate 10R-lipoxygenase
MGGFAVCISGLYLTCNHSFFLASQDIARGEKEQRELIGALAGTPESAKKIGQYFYDKTKELVAARSFKLVGGKVGNVDIVRDVLNFVSLHWAATELVS